jgi:coenzyme F420-dependent glucose-6-phosphate dehydrogenase
MPVLGYTLSSEEFGPLELVANAVEAEAAGFSFVGISDHFLPWVPKQGHSPFAWTVIGGLTQATKRLDIFVEVTCPILRYHPAIIAQAAATAQIMSNGRFILGLGTGEYLNEHIVGLGWPHIKVRQAMLEEAVDLIRQLFAGGQVDYYGEFMTAEAAKLYDLPAQLPPIIVSAFGPRMAEIAGRIGDGLVSTAPQKELLVAFDKAGGAGKPKYGQVNVCYAASREEALKTAHKNWPVAGLQGQAMSELRLPEYFAKAVEPFTPEQATSGAALGPDPKEYFKLIDQYVKAGYTHLYFHQIGPDQQGFIDFAKKELLPKYR